MFVQINFLEWNLLFPIQISPKFLPTDPMTISHHWFRWSIGFGTKQVTIKSLGLYRYEQCLPSLLAQVRHSMGLDGLTQRTHGAKTTLLVRQTTSWSRFDVILTLLLRRVPAGEEIIGLHSAIYVISNFHCTPLFRQQSSCAKCAAIKNELN